MPRSMHLGAMPFSIYNTYTPEQIEHLLNDAGSGVAITEQASRTTSWPRATASTRSSTSWSWTASRPRERCRLDELIARGADDFDFEAAWKAVQPDDVLTLIYTSGTTGPPKGVQITHENICATVRSYDEMIEFPDGGRIVSYLPMAHVAERNVSHYLPMLCGFTVTCCPDAREVIAYLPEVRPTLVLRRPADLGEAEGRPGADARGPRGAAEAAGQALDASLEKVRLEQAGKEVPAELAERVAKADEEMFSKLRSASASTSSRPATSARRRRPPR